VFSLSLSLTHTHKHTLKNKHRISLLSLCPHFPSFTNTHERIRTRVSLYLPLSLFLLCFSDSDIHTQLTHFFNLYPPSRSLQLSLSIFFLIFPIFIPRMSLMLFTPLSLHFFCGIFFQPRLLSDSLKILSRIKQVELFLLRKKQIFYYSLDCEFAFIFKHPILSSIFTANKNRGNNLNTIFCEL
jgi:hypothetical protein